MRTFHDPELQALAEIAERHDVQASWLSELTGVHISAPDSIRSLTDKIGEIGINFVPGGDIVNSIFNPFNAGGGQQGMGLDQLAQRTAYNVQNAARTGLYAAQSAQAAQNQASQVGLGLNLLTSSPVGLALLAVVGYLIFRRR